MKRSYLKDGFVFKEAKELDKKWKKKLEAILKVIKIPAFAFFTHNGYASEYIDGIDLQDDLPFEPRHDLVREVVLNDLQRKRVIKIFKDIVYAGIKTNYTLADFTKRNIMLKGDVPYLIDYDVIVEGELPQDYIDLFQKMIDYLGINYKFNGDLKKLYKKIGGDV